MFITLCFEKVHFKITQHSVFNTVFAKNVLPTKPNYWLQDGVQKNRFKICQNSFCIIGFAFISLKNNDNSVYNTGFAKMSMRNKLNSVCNNEFTKVLLKNKPN